MSNAFQFDGKGGAFPPENGGQVPRGTFFVLRLSGHGDRECVAQFANRPDADACVRELTAAHDHDPQPARYCVSYSSYKEIQQ
jgi:hypothetical protein